jgi:tripartite-type tricarboxylate transporter receptor subunit TctC
VEADRRGGGEGSGEVNRRISLVALALLVAGTFSTARAQGDYPNRPLRIVVDSAAGSTVDVVTRIVADKLGQSLGQQVQVLNHPGGGGAIAARVAAAATNDGYTIYAPAASSFITLAGKAQNLPLMLPRDFAPIGFLSEQPMFVSVIPSFGVSTLPELVVRAKAQPGALSYAATGVGRISHLTAELLQMRAGMKMQLVPYTGGPAQALNDALGGRVPIVVEGYPGVIGAVRSGALKPIAVSSAQRLGEFPDVATVSEMLPDFNAGGWQVFVAPLGTPDPILKRLGAEINKVLSLREVIDRFAAIGGYPRLMTAEQAVAFVQAQQRQWTPVLEQIARETAK